MAWVRMCGGSNFARSIIGQLNSLSRTDPSNTALANTTPRTFVKNSYVLGLTENNYYAASNITYFSFTGANSFILTGSSGYGFGAVLSDVVKPNYTYKIEYTVSNANSNIYASFYTSTGAYIGVTNRLTDGGTFTVPSTAEYVVLGVSGPSNTQISFTLDNVERVA